MAEEERLTAILLGAGLGERMGGPKALLLITGEPLYLLHARRAREAGCSDVVLVTNRNVASVLPTEPGVRIVLSDEAETSGSLARGCSALGEAGICLITPVDAVPASVPTITLLFQTIRDGAEAATPLFLGRGGHPVVCRRDVLLPYFGERPFPTLRDRLAGLGERRVRVSVTDPNVTLDLDRPADVSALTGAPPAFWKKSMLR
ncbi:MAG: NTP transferase domain-containing protein [Polyangiaceae bacterium]